MTALRRRVEVDHPLRSQGLAAVAVALACAYAALFVVRLPTLLTQLNSDGDVGTAWLLASVSGVGHPGDIVTSAQGAWASLGYGVLTRGLPFHRLLWLVSPLVLSLVAIGMLARTVARLGGARAGCVTAALVFCASPTARVLLIAPWFHNTTLVGTVACGATLVVLHASHGDRRWIYALAGATGLLLGPLLASDEMLIVVGLVPFAFATLAIAIRARDPGHLGPAGGLLGAAVGGDIACGIIVRRLGLITGPSPVHVSLSLIPRRVEWVVSGILRLGGGLPLEPVSPIRAVLIGVAGVASLAGVATVLWLGWGALERPAEGEMRARSAHLIFWAASVACTLVSYVLSVSVASDRYLATLVLAVAAVVPLAPSGRLSSARLMGVCTFLAASIVALAVGDTALSERPAVGSAGANALARFVAMRHLGVGYAGYWEAAPLDWNSDLRLHVYPITDVPGPGLSPPWNGHVTAWYRPRRTSSFLLLEPGDATLSDRLPASLPRPAHVYRVGLATIAAYRFDIATDFRR